VSNIMTDMYTVTAFDRISCETVKDYNFSKYSDCYSILENLILCDKLFVGENGVTRYNLNTFCEDFKEIVNHFSDDKLYDSGQKYPFGQMDIYERGMVYADLARESGCYYAPHPNREASLVTQISNFMDRTSVTVLEKFDQKLRESTSGLASNLDVKVPPVVEHVLAFSKANGISVAEGVKEIRESKNAKHFRSYFNALDSELKDLSPRKRITVFQPLFKDIDNLCNVWIGDLDAEVKYRQRKIKLSKIPVIGKMLEICGVGEVDVKDPIIRAEKSHFLFINDMYR